MYEWRLGNQSVNYKAAAVRGSTTESFIIYHFSVEHLWTEKSPVQGHFQQKSYTRLDVILSAEMTK